MLAFVQLNLMYFSSILSILDILKMVVERVCYEKILLEKQTNIFCTSSGEVFQLKLSSLLL